MGGDSDSGSDSGSKFGYQYVILLVVLVLLVLIIWRLHCRSLLRETVALPSKSTPGARPDVEAAPCPGSNLGFLELTVSPMPSVDHMDADGAATILGRGIDLDGATSNPLQGGFSV
jgi:hypothetical protein